MTTKPDKCHARTKKGSPCARKAGADGYCYQHSPAAPSAEPALTEKQRRFVEEYCIDCNGAGAAKRAGYQGDPASLASTAYNLLTNTDIRAAIDERLDVLGMTAAEATARLVQMARATIEPFVSGYTEAGEPILNLSTAEARAHLHLLRGVKYDKFGNLVIELHDAKDAVKTIMKMHGVLTDRVEHTGKDGGPITVASAVDLSRLSSEDLAALENILEKTENE